MMTERGSFLWYSLTEHRKAVLADFLLFGSGSEYGGLRLGISAVAYRETLKGIKKKFGLRGSSLVLLKLCRETGIYPD